MGVPKALPALLLLALLAAALTALGAASEDYTVQALEMSLYRDGSISAKLVASYPLKTHDYVINAAAKVRCGATTALDLSLNVTSSSALIPIAVRMVLTGTSRVIGATVARFEGRALLSVEGPEAGDSLRVELESLNTTSDVNAMKLRFSTSFKVLGSGRYRETVASVPLMMEALRFYLPYSPYGEAVEVKDVRLLSLTENAAEGVVDVEVNYLKLVEILAPGVNTTALREVLSAGKLYGGRVELRVEAAGNAVMIMYGLELDCETNECLAEAARGLKMAVEWLTKSSPVAPPDVVVAAPPRLLEALVAALEDFVGTFEVRPSSGSIVLQSVQDAVILRVETPRISKRGARSVAETLTELYNYSVRVAKNLREAGVAMNLQALMEVQIALRTEEGVRVRMEGGEVLAVRFGDLPKLEVEVEAAATTTPPQGGGAVAQAIPWAAVAASVAVVAVAAAAVVLVRRRP